MGGRVTDNCSSLMASTHTTIHTSPIAYFPHTGHGLLKTPGQNPPCLPTSQQNPKSFPWPVYQELLLPLWAHLLLHHSIIPTQAKWRAAPWTHQAHHHPRAMHLPSPLSLMLFPQLAHSFYTGLSSNITFSETQPSPVTLFKTEPTPNQTPLSCVHPDPPFSTYHYLLPYYTYFPSFYVLPIFPTRRFCQFFHLGASSSRDNI